ncbi:hypothetical protein BC962_3263 [Gillisia mitskevichiae]|uniref:Uncharacterized protein n=1 Tax=Gillisia mitskevichiae TaxID=270921 RepID=A0A495NXM8_9FLAO|nr:hypothetical protein [Gillisia mitskevichiae]RKS42505.1 hypothetical protein BC962_3263 [Gillisia mitskevichiae]
MKSPYTIIFFGILSILMGLGDDQNEIIPSEIKFSTGVLFIIYGIFLLYKNNNSGRVKGNSKSEIGKKYIKRYSFIYLAIGALLVKTPSFLFPDTYLELNLTVISIYIIGSGFLIYGLNMFLKEKRLKKESGFIE